MKYTQTFNEFLGENFKKKIDYNSVDSDIMGYAGDEEVFDEVSRSVRRFVNNKKTKQQMKDMLTTWFQEKDANKILDQIYESSVLESSNEDEAKALLSRVQNLFGREYGKGKKYENTLGGKLLDDISDYLKNNK